MQRFRKFTLAAALATTISGAGSALAQPAPGYYVAPPGPAYVVPAPPPPGWHRWHHGDRFHGRPHVVDWRYYRLPPPPYGYQWIKDGPQFLMVGIGTGYVARVLVP